MIDALFPHGNIVVYLISVIAFLLAYVWGYYKKERSFPPFDLEVICIALIFSYLFYHFLGAFEF